MTQRSTALSMEGPRDEALVLDDDQRFDRATVVVIHDRPAVLELAEQALRDAGHYVFVTRDPNEIGALSEVMLIDLAIGTGEALSRLQGVRPCPRLLEIALESVAGREPSPLQTPFSLKQLQNAVELVLPLKP